MTAEEWNARHPVGTPVRYFPSRGNLRCWERRQTASLAWSLDHGQAVVVKLAGKSGGVSIEHLLVLPEEPARAQPRRLTGKDAAAEQRSETEE